MKFRFTACDAQGRPTSGVLRAESEDDAREALLGDNVFPKRLEPAPGDPPVTWNSRRRVLSRHEAEATTAKRVLAEVSVATLEGTEGALAVTEAGVLRWLPKPPGEALEWPLAECEVALITGFPRRQLRIVRLDGAMLEFHAGWLVAAAPVRRLASLINGSRSPK